MILFNSLFTYNLVTVGPYMNHAHDFANLRHLQESVDELVNTDIHADDDDPLAQDAATLREYIKAYVNHDSMPQEQSEALSDDLDILSANLTQAASSYRDQLEVYLTESLMFDMSYASGTSVNDRTYRLMAGCQFKS